MDLSNADASLVVKLAVKLASKHPCLALRCRRATNAVARKVLVARKRRRAPFSTDNEVRQVSFGSMAKNRILANPPKGGLQT